MLKLKKAFIYGILFVYLAGVAAALPFFGQKDADGIVAGAGNAGIVDVTGKYKNVARPEDMLNPDVVKKSEIKIDGNQKFDVIVMLEGGSPMDRVLSDGSGAKGLAGLLTSPEGSYLKKDIKNRQSSFLGNLTRAGISYKAVNSFGTLFNGLTVNVKYSDIPKLEGLPGVASAMVSRTYGELETAVPTASLSAVSNEVKVYETGIFDSSDVSFDGTGTLVAVLDSGFDVSHSVFANTPHNMVLTSEYVGNVLSQTTADKKNAVRLKTGDVYFSDKIPFSYDYADNDADVYPAESGHGTHVAGIIAGNDSVIKGVATGAQLALMKVFSDKTAGAKTEDILAALEDAVLLNADVINLSLGTTAGFTREADDDFVNMVYDKIGDAGISLIIAAGNEQSSGYSTTHGNTGLTSNPDTGTIGSPASYVSALSVASISGVKSPYLLADGDFAIYYTESSNSAGNEYNFLNMILESQKRLGAFEYVVVPGYGQLFNYSGIDVRGKIAVVKRGDITFEQKQQYAYENGAIACIVYNNVSGGIKMGVGLLKVPTVSVAYDIGVVLEARGKGRIVLDKGFVAGPFMSDFSSWGPMPDLTLKPEITAHGGNIYSAVPGGYDKYSGTSMAAPNMAGAVTLIRQYVKERWPSLPPKEVTAMVNQLLMSTASLAKTENGDPYSPRRQGAGLASLSNATSTGAYVFIDGIEMTKLELYDDPDKTGVYDMDINLRNVSGGNLSFDIKTVVMTESVSSDKKTVAEQPHMLTGGKTEIVSAANASRNGTVVTVGAGQTAAIKIRQMLSADEKKYLDDNFVNGMYVEGYLKLYSQNADKIDLSVPFLAFYGDWTKAPLFDKTYYEVEEDLFNQSIRDDDKRKADVYATTPYGRYETDYIFPLGKYIYKTEGAYTDKAAEEDKAALSIFESTINGLYSIYAGLLRNAKTVIMTVEEAYTGRVIFEQRDYNCRKAMYHSEYGRVMPYSDEYEFYTYAENLASGGKYTVRLQAELDYGKRPGSGNLRDEFSFSFYADYEAPSCEDVSFYQEYDRYDRKTRTYMDLKVFDNHYVQAIRLMGLNGDQKLFDLSHYPFPVSGGRNESSTVTYEITDYLDRIYGSADPDHIYAYVEDYALNASIFALPLPTTGFEGLMFRQDSADISVNQTYDLKGILSINGNWGDTLTWTSSDENVARVFRGEVLGVSKGTAKLTAAYSENGIVVYTDEIIVNVLGAGDTGYQRFDPPGVESVKFTEFKTLFSFYDDEYRMIGDKGDTVTVDTSSIDLFPRESFILSFELKPWSLDLSKVTVAWSSSNVKVASVSGGGMVTALAKGSATITAKVSYNGRETIFSARFAVNVASEFVMVGALLKDYKGLGGHVVIPEDLGVKQIGDFAFAQKRLKKDVNGVIQKDADDIFIYEPIGGSNITGIEFSSDIEIVGKYAFYGSTKLKTVRLNDKLKTIYEGAFEDCISLASINLDNVKQLGARAFCNCPSANFGDMNGLIYIGARAFYRNTKITSLDLTNLHGSGEGAFEECVNLGSVTLGEATKLSADIFGKCARLTEITIPMAYVPEKAFRNSGLVSVTFTKGTRIGAYAFENCRSLSNVTFNASVSLIDIGAFKDCAALAALELPDSEITISANAFSGAGLSVLKFKAGTKAEFGAAAFHYCPLSGFDTSVSNIYSSQDGVLYDKDKTRIIYVAPEAGLVDFVLPDTVRTIGKNAFSFRQDIRTFTVNDTSALTSIGSEAFAGCSRLTAVTLPARDIDIGAYAFADCVSLNTVVNLDRISVFAEFSFAGTGLTSITLKDNAVIGSHAFYYNTLLDNVTLGKNTVIGEGAFKLCDYLTTVNMPGEGGVRIGDEAFMYDFNLWEIDLSKAVGKLGAAAFYACISLETADLRNITHVGADAFANSDDLINAYYVMYLRSVNLSSAVEIGEYAFYGCMMLTEVIVSDKLAVIGEGAFAYCGILSEKTNESASLQFVLSGVSGTGLSKVVEIGAFAFIGSGLTEADLSSAVIIGEMAFYNSKNLAKVKLSGGLNYIPYGAFAGCANLEQINLGGVRYIDEMAFYADSKLNGIDTSNVISFGYGAFAWCTGLKSASLANARYIGEMAFYGSGLTEARLTAKIEEIGYAAFALTPGLNMFSADAGGGGKIYDFIINDRYFVSGGVLYGNINGGYILLCYPALKADTSYSVIEGTVRVDGQAAQGNAFLRELTLPYTLRAVGSMAFYDCAKLEKVNFNSLKAPDLEALYDDNLVYTTQNLPEGLFDYSIYLQYYYYANFKDYIGFAEKMTITYPSNGIGYDNYIYSRYFSDKEIRAAIADDVTRTLILAIDSLPAVITLEDEGTLLEIRGILQFLDSEQKAFVTNLSALEKAESDLASLKEQAVVPPPTPPEVNDGLTGLEIALIASGAVIAAGAAAFIAVYFLKIKKKPGAEK